MNTESFKSELLAQGYDDIELRVMPAGTFNDRHTHDFDVRALMLEGELTLTWEGREHTFRPGEIFTMAAGCPHVERFGASDTRYLVGRKHAAI